MAFFPREFYGPTNTGFHPLFRLLDDFDTYSRQSNGNGHHRKGHLPSFQPKFDVRELEEAFELHGELAGLNKQDVSIEFTDPQTLVVRGRIERTYQAGTPPAGLEGAKMSGAITEAGEETKKNDHHATVEDAADDEDGSTTAEATPATTVAEVAKPQQEEKSAPKAKFWVSERSVGDFSRTFTFPGRIDQDNVTAKLDDGILTVRVPKAPKHEARRINIA
jgi:HSP20 family molecular chaperone IbpA